MTIHTPPEGASPARVPEAEVNDAPKMKRVRGHWRNRWQGPHQPHWDGPDPRDGTHFGYGRWPSREVAEEKALRFIVSGGREGIYLGPVFFPEQDQ